MEITGGEEEGFVREWAPCNHMLSLIPQRVQNGLFSSELQLTCVDAVSEYVALGTNIGLVYWYDRKKGNIQRLRCEASTSNITYVKIVSTVDYMVGAGNAAGQVTVFQIPKEHPDSVPDTLKPKIEPKVERYTIGDLHKSAITAIEWSKNGMRLFSGDKNGVIIMTEIDFYMHLCKSMEIVNEEHEIVQMSCHQSCLLVSSLYRTILCDRVNGRWQVTQVGKKERKSLCRLGAVFQFSYRPECSTTNGSVLCARAGMRIWRADRDGEVLQTLLFKEAVNNPLTIAELLNPSHSKHTQCELELGPLHIFRERFIVSYSDNILYILDPRSVTAVAVVDDLRRILSVSVNKEEIFILEGPRSLVRLGHTPETGANITEPTNLMTKSLTTSIQQAVNTVKDFAHIDQTVPFIASQAISIFTIGDPIGQVTKAEECFETPTVKLQDDNVLESIIDEFRDVSYVDEIRKARSEELQRKLKLYNSIMQRQYEPELIHSSRRSRRKESSSGGSTPRTSTPVRKCGKNDGEIYTSPCVMTMSGYSAPQQEADDKLLEQQIEEKEKILAKLLDIESLSIKHDTETKDEEKVQRPQKKLNPFVIRDVVEAPPVIAKNNIATDRIIEKTKEESVPRLSKIPITWNLDGIELENNKTGSPDLSENEWEFV